MRHGFATLVLSRRHSVVRVFLYHPLTALDVLILLSLRSLSFPHALCQMCHTKAPTRHGFTQSVGWFCRVVRLACSICDIHCFGAGGWVDWSSSCLNGFPHYAGRSHLQICGVCCVLFDLGVLCFVLVALVLRWVWLICWVCSSISSCFATWFAILSKMPWYIVCR